MKKTGDEIKFYPSRVPIERSLIEIGGRRVGYVTRYDGEPYKATVGILETWPGQYFEGETYEEIRVKIKKWMEGR